MVNQLAMRQWLRLPQGLVIKMKTLIICFALSFTLHAQQWDRQGTVVANYFPSDQQTIAEPTLIAPEGGCVLIASSPCFKMWFSVGWSLPATYYAESPDGFSWTRTASPVVAGHNRPFVIRNGATLIMFAVPNPGDQIDEYISTDGLNWTLAHAGVIAQSEGWDVAGVANTGGTIISGTLYLFVEGLNANSVWSVGLFTSTDLATFTQAPGNPLIVSASGGSCGGPSVPYLTGAGWIMWTHCSSTGNLPTDIYRWRAGAITGPWYPALNFSDYPRLSSDEGVNTTVGQVADPFVLPVGNSTYMFYSASADGGQASGYQHIKLAIANEPIAALAGTSGGEYSGSLGAQGNTAWSPQRISVNTTKRVLDLEGSDIQTAAGFGPCWDIIAEGPSGQVPGRISLYNECTFQRVVLAQQ